jgi:hypothetical protein
MQKIAGAIGRDLAWVQPGVWKMEYELRAGDDLVATLRFRSAFGTFATGESADGCWTFKRVGFCQSRVTIRACGSETDVAIFRNNTWTGGGTLELPGGRRIPATTNFWQSKLEFKTGADEVLIRLETGGFVRRSATVEIQPAAAGAPELPWLVMLGWYLAVMMEADASAAGAAVAVS